MRLYRMMLFVIFTISLLFAQQRHSWDMVLPVPDGTNDLYIRRLAPTNDGKFVGVGSVVGHSNGAYDFVAVKFDQSGRVKWMIRDSAFSSFWGYAVALLPNGKFLWGGVGCGSDGMCHPVFGIMDDTGNILSREVCETSYENDAVKDAAFSSGDTTIMVTERGYILLVDTTGQLLDVKEVDLSDYDLNPDVVFIRIIRSSFGGFYLLGWIDTFNADSNATYARALVVKINSRGETLWASVFNFPYCTDAVLYAGTIMEMGRSLLVAGYGYSQTYGYVGVIGKIDALTGTPILRLSLPDMDWITGAGRVRTVWDERYMVVGVDKSSGGRYIAVIMLDSELNERYRFEYQHRTFWGYITDMEPTGDGGYLFTIYYDTTTSKSSTRVVKPAPGFFYGTQLKIMFPQDSDTIINNKVSWNGPKSMYGNINYTIYVDDSLVQRTKDTFYEIPDIFGDRMRKFVVKIEDNLGINVVPSADTVYTYPVTYPQIRCLSQLRDTSSPGPFKVVAEIKDVPAGIDSAFLFYRRRGKEDWQKILMSPVDTVDIYYAIIPESNSHNVDTVDYYFVAYDGASPVHTTCLPADAPNTFFSFLANLNSGIEEDYDGEDVLKPVVKVFRSGKEMVFRIILDRETCIRLEIWDVNGRIRIRTADRLLKKGNNTIRVKDLTKGLYFYRIYSRDFEIKGKVFF